MTRFVTHWRKLAIQKLRLKTRRLAAQRRELTAEAATIRSEYRGTFAGRDSTLGFGRGTTGRIMRAGVRANRRSQRVEHERNAIDIQMLAVDHTVARLEAGESQPL